MLLFVMILLMGSFDIKKFIKKPAVAIAGVVAILIIVFFVLFGRGGGQDPAAKSVKDLSNRHQALVGAIDSYSKDIKSASLKSNISQISIILTADKNDIDTYYSGFSKEIRKKVKASVKTKPTKEVLDSLEQAKISNNLDSELKSTIRSELEAIQSSVQRIKKSYPDKKELGALADKLILNTQTMLVRLDESR